MLEKEIEARLGAIQDRETGRSWQISRVVQRIDIAGETVKITLRFAYPIEAIRVALEAEVNQALAGLPIKQCHVQVEQKIETHVARSGIPALSPIKNIIAIASGKGGVGKSFVTNHLAIALKRQGAEVGILDADVYGPSQHAMLGAAERRSLMKDNRLLPVKEKGIQSMSMGYLVAQEAAMMWRGPMIGKALQQMLSDTAWEPLDYLLVDLPPGTGDIQLTLCQKMPLSAALIVTTPQDIALLDVRRACEMFVKLGVPILGVVENMSHYECRHCGHTAAIFGEGAGRQLEAAFNVPSLGAIPLDAKLREMTDAGESERCQTDDARYASLFSAVARKMVARLSLQPKDYSHRLGHIRVKEE